MQRSEIPEFLSTFSYCHHTKVSHDLLMKERPIPFRKNNNFSMFHRRHVVAPR